MKINVEILDVSFYEKFGLPSHATEGSAAIDLRAALKLPTTLWPGQSRKIPTSLKFEVPEGYAMLLIPRSGLGHDYGIVLGNLTGLIDSDYRGEVQVSLWNRGTAPVDIKPGDRIAQAVFVPHLRVELNPVESLSQTTRGEGGFGSTGER